MWDYTEKVKSLYMNPKNAGILKDADVVAEVGSIMCGDALKLYLKIDSDTITDARFQTFGCGSAIAASSALTEMIIGMKITDAEKLTNDDIVNYMGGLPEEKVHCSVMGSDALKKAISMWKGMASGDNDTHEGEEICFCSGITDAQIKKIISEKKAMSFDEVMIHTGAGKMCGSCIPEIEDLIHDNRPDPSQPQKIKKEDKIRASERISLIDEIITSSIRPVLRKKGGDVVLIDVNGDDVYVALRGNCSNCVSSNVTFRNFVEQELRKQVGEEITVNEVQ